MTNSLNVEPWRMLRNLVLIYVAVGYILFYFAVLFSVAGWCRALVEYFSASISALNNASRVSIRNGDDPFPSQIVILYCAFGSIALSIGCIRAWVFNKDALQASLSSYRAIKSTERPSRLRIFIAGFVALFGAVLGWYVLFFLNTKSNTVSWRDAAFFSSSLPSVTFLMACSVMFATCVSAAIVAFYIALSKHSQN